MNDPARVAKETGWEGVGINGGSTRSFNYLDFNGRPQSRPTGDLVVSHEEKPGRRGQGATPAPTFHLSSIFPCDVKRDAFIIRGLISRARLGLGSPASDAERIPIPRYPAGVKRKSTAEHFHPRDYYEREERGR